MFILLIRPFYGWHRLRDSSWKYTSNVLAPIKNAETFYNIIKNFYCTTFPVPQLALSTNVTVSY
jgi:hypothetical protein